MKSKRVCDSQVTMSELMMPRVANHYGNVHGGTILQMADQVAFVVAARHAGPPCVTAAVDSVSFLGPIRIGEVVTMLASVNHAGRTSMEIGLKVLAENLETGAVRHTNSCYFVYVAVDAAGQPRAVPPLLVESEEEQRRFRGAERRRELRLKLRSESRPL